MCQIFAGTSRQIRGVLLDTQYLLADLYENNSDGLGAMYPTSKRGLRIRKVVPHTLSAAERFIRELPDDDRNLVLHFRMKTSGNIDRDNAHPFTVLPRSLAMTHNGVLTISTKSDETKCDTRHYIERVLLPQLSKFPDLVAVPEWLSLVGEDIGTNNRFVFMDSEGQMHFVNRHTGIEHEGMWVANTYSFDASLLIPGYSKQSWYGGYSWGRGSYKDYDDAYDGYWPDTGAGNVAGVVVPVDGAGIELPDDTEYALANYDVETLAELIEEFPLATFQYLFRHYQYETSVGMEELAAQDRHLAKLLADEDVTGLAALVRFNPNKARHLAEVCCWYGDWMHRLDEDDTLEVEEVANEQYAA